MEKDKKSLDKVTSEMVDQFIAEYYAADSERMDILLNSYSAVIKPEIDIERIVSNFNFDRNELIKNVNHYEDELVRMIDLATVLSGKYTESDNRELFISFLLEKNKEILPDIIEIIQLLKNK